MHDVCSDIDIEASAAVMSASDRGTQLHTAQDNTALIADVSPIHYSHWRHTIGRILT